ncbi:hypothetical protein DFP73DRAFT_533929, partial [Morchella snyderi]
GICTGYVMLLLLALCEPAAVRIEVDGMTSRIKKTLLPPFLLILSSTRSAIHHLPLTLKNAALISNKPFCQCGA